jgi:hypothetical protein
MITSILKWFRTKFLSKQPTITTQEEESDVVGAITFKLYKNKEISIACYIPETKDFSIDQMTQLSEDYAELLMYVNEGLLATKIIEFIKTSMTNTELEQDKLFFENVLVFWTMHHVEHTKQKKIKSNQPLIRPTSVFGP